MAQVVKSSSIFCPCVYPQLIQFQSYRRQGTLYFMGYHWLLICCITECSSIYYICIIILMTVYLIQTCFFKKWVIPGHFIIYFRLFYNKLTVNNCSIKVANDWIRTRVVWFWKRPRYQLCHNHSLTCSFNWWDIESTMLIYYLLAM